MPRVSDFDREKDHLLYFMRTLQKAQSAAELRALLMADMGSLWHSFDPMTIAASVENMGVGLAQLMDDDLDSEEALA
ncbi:hypothetical protein [Acidovorax sp. SUPP3334]|uniref:hypothetical protein n=1 Tax=Acidovorax sp. SUPP3334 TaxID=2920881 RepID=UPI0023DE69D1|nr:hypothetical protein [Acidovorax sp. SUPP3334]GKT22560.1 hypothetical protein AVHM3334_08835 [Acidovorax sp. SUPP3334]